MAGATTFQVTDSRGHTCSGTLVGAFPEDDLAVVHAQGASLPSATFASSPGQVGDIVLAIGNPLGLRSSVTEGIISALGRTVDEPNGVVLPNVIQTSAAINPGNSGGALVNLDGQVVGIPTLAATDRELGGSAAPGIGFAIPELAGQGHRGPDRQVRTRGQRAPRLPRRHARCRRDHRAVVVSVQPGGPAARAGIVPGDVITAINGQPISSPVDSPRCW